MFMFYWVSVCENPCLKLIGAEQCSSVFTIRTTALNVKILSTLLKY